MRLEREAKERALPKLTNFFTNKQIGGVQEVQSKVLTAGHQTKQTSQRVPMI